MHLLFRFPSGAPDSLPQALRVVSGAGRPIRRRFDPGGPFGLKWNGEPSSLVPKQSWMLVTLRQQAYGWVRFCHAEDDAGNYFRDPLVVTGGMALYADRYVRFSDPFPEGLPSALRGRRSRYLDQAEAALMRVPLANGGVEVAWVDEPTGALRRGCCP